MERMKKATEGLKKAMSKLIEEVLGRRGREAQDARNAQCAAAVEAEIKKRGGAGFRKRLASLKRQMEAAGLSQCGYGEDGEVRLSNDEYRKIDNSIPEVQDYAKLREDLLKEVNLASTYGDVDDIVKKAQSA